MNDARCKPVLYVIIPCYNEREVLPVTNGDFLAELKDLISKQKISKDSRILFVNDGSSDDTWDIIKNLSAADPHFTGICLSRNRGHQNAVLAGMMEAKDHCDIVITIDCDGQDDISAMEQMVDQYRDGSEVVYGVRNNRDSDTFFKKFTAQGYYKLLNLMGVECVYNHADYRLMSSKVLNALEGFTEVNLFLRGMIPLVGFKSSCVYYSRAARKAGESHYPLRKMLALAVDGITSLSIKPIRIITMIGFLMASISFLGIIWSVIAFLLGETVAGWTSMICILCFVGGGQLLALGIIGEYIGKIYLETKRRPRYIISDRTVESIERSV